MSKGQTTFLRGRPLLHRAVALFLVLALAGVAYLSCAPVPIEPVAWEAPPAPGYVGPHAPNDRLARLHHLPLGAEQGPEGMAVGPDGTVYASVLSGAILRLRPGDEGPERWINTGGRALGMDVDAAGRLVAADAMRGLLAIDPDGTHRVLADAVDGDPIRYANGVAVARSGLVYFTDSSRRFGAREWGGTFEASLRDILEHSATGRVLVYDPVTDRTRTVMRDLCFANGVALSADETRLYVAETCAYRVWSIDPAARDLSARDAEGPQARVLLSNLPGYPDNLTRGRNGRTWLGLAKPRAQAVDRLAGLPFLRKVVLRLPRALWPIPPAYGHVLAFDDAGTVVADLQDPSGDYPETTGVLETRDRLWVQSLHAHGLAWLDPADAGLVEDRRIDADPEGR